ncbi:DUF5723 family protein [Hymenobacter terrenus]|uniref:DUF5723 family protein n=1 Tax=Hymenobacter terrenus TaxID=1629124 RepID=UPI000619B57B|nr:DUF5723 family protein [Hymenobacter terrenus]
MKVSLRRLPLVALLALPAAVHAQNELSNFTATGRGGVINTFAQDYQAIGINPANLGRPGESLVAFTILEGGGGLASRSLSKTLLRRILFDSSQPIGAAGKAELVNGFEGKNALNINADVTTLGFAISLPNGLGGIAVSNRQRLGAHLALNRNAADVIINGQKAASMQQYFPTDAAGNYTGTGLPAPPISNFLNGTTIQLAWTSEYNLSYGVRVLDNAAFKLSVGAGYRYIQGIGIADIQVKSGSLSAYSSLSPIFKVDYGQLASNQQFNLKSGSGLRPVGSGNGFDLGVAAEIGKLVRVGASVTDVGSMTWKGNVVTASDQLLQPTAATGVETYNVLKGIINQFDTDKNNLFSYQAAQKRSASLPAKLRLGAGVRLSSLFEAGIDVTTPLNKVAGNLTSTFVGLGVDFKPTPWLRLSSGLTGGAGYGASLPLGFTLVSPIWEAGISSRDVTGYFNEKSPYYSAALGFLRFKIGGKS